MPAFMFFNAADEVICHARIKGAVFMAGHDVDIEV